MPELITSPDDPRLDPFRAVADPKRVREQGLFVAEGRRVVEGLLAEPRYTLRGLLLTTSARDALGARLDAVTVETLLVDGPAALRDVTGHRFHQGCLALAELPAERDVGGLDCVRSRDATVLVVLEGVTDPDNVGTIFRSARAFGVDAVVLGPGCAHPLYRKALRTSLGTALHVPFVHARTWPGPLEVLRQADVELLALTPAEDALPLAVALGSSRSRRRALLLGSEERGLGDDALELSDVRVRIVHEPAMDSLNVAAAAAIGLQHLYERRVAPMA